MIGLLDQKDSLSTAETAAAADISSFSSTDAAALLDKEYKAEEIAGLRDGNFARYVVSIVSLISMLHTLYASSNSRKSVSSRDFLFGNV